MMQTALSTWGPKVSTAGGADDDITNRLCKARAVFG